MIVTLMDEALQELDNFNFPLIFLDREYRIERINTSALKLHGFKKKGIIGKDYLALCEKMALGCVLSDPAVLRVKKGKKVEVEVSYSKEQGDDTVVSWDVLGLFDSENILKGFMLQGKEITHQKINKSNLDYLSEVSKKTIGQPLDGKADFKECIEDVVYHFENIIAQMPGSVYWKSREGVYLGANDEAARLTGFASRHDFIGKTDAFVAEKLNWPKGIVESFQEIDREVLAGRRTLNKEEAPFVTAEGKTISQLTNKVALYDRKRNIVGILGISIDVTDRNQQIFDYLSKISKKVIGKPLDRNADFKECIENIVYHFENIIAQMPGSVFWKSRDGVYLGGNNNAAKLVGLSSRKELEGKSDSYFSEKFHWPKNVAESFEKDNQRVLKGESILNREEPPFMTAEGDIVVQLTNKVPIYDKHQEAVGILGISIDITARKEMEKSLKEAKKKAEAANHAKSLFIANMSHDIRTPLTGIIGMGQIIKKQAEKDAVRQDAQHLVAAGQSLLDMLNEVVDIVQMDVTQQPVASEKFDFFLLINKIMDLMLPAVRSKKIKLERCLNDNIPQYLIGDSVRIYRILLNLIGNAIKFTSKGSVTISADIEEENKKIITLKLSVKDTGIGIPTEKHNEIFSQFTRLSPSYEGIYQGSGLGLFIVKNFTDELGGEIYVESEPGKGSNFVCLIPLKKTLLQGSAQGLKNLFTRVKLPKVFGQPQESVELVAPVSDSVSEKTPSSATVSSSSTDGLPVILVEDNKLAQIVGRSLLEDLGCNVKVASTGEEALAVFKEGNWGLIFMDLGLPDQDGYSVTRAIREWEKGKKERIPIIALTAHVNEKEEQQCYDAGIDVVLRKPLSEEAATALIDRFILSDEKVSADEE